MKITFYIKSNDKTKFKSNKTVNLRPTQIHLSRLLSTSTSQSTVINAQTHLANPSNLHLKQMSALYAINYPPLTCRLIKIIYRSITSPIKNNLPLCTFLRGRKKKLRQNVVVHNIVLFMSLRFFPFSLSHSRVCVIHGIGHHHILSSCRPSQWLNKLPRLSTIQKTLAKLKSDEKCFIMLHIVLHLELGPYR